MRGVRMEAMVGIFMELNGFVFFVVIRIWFKVPLK